MYSIHFNNNPLRVRKLHKDSFVNYICFPRFLRKRECDVNTKTLLVIIGEKLWIVKGKVWLNKDNFSANGLLYCKDNVYKLEINHSVVLGCQRCSCLLDYTELILQGKLTSEGCRYCYQILSWTLLFRERFSEERARKCTRQR